MYIPKWYQITHNSYSISIFNKRHDNKLSVSTMRATSKRLLANSKLHCSHILVKFSLHIASFPLSFFFYLIERYRQLPSSFRRFERKCTLDKKTFRLMRNGPLCCLQEINRIFIVNSFRWLKRLRLNCKQMKYGVKYPYAVIYTLLHVMNKVIPDTRHININD